MCSQFKEEDFINHLDLPDIYTLGIPGYYTCAKNAQEDSTAKKYKGYFFKTQDNRCRIIIGDEANKFCYRGENKIYQNFVPSLKRCESKLKHCVEWIRADQFKEAFKTTPYYKILPNQIKIMNKYNFEFDLDAIAQHYGFKTNYIDITRNRDIAEFFAYTYIDKNGKYKPITDFDEYHPMLYCASLDKLIRHSPDKIKIVGFQAVLRPLLQEAMAISIDDDNDNFKEQFFAVIELERSAIKAKEVFDKFQGGYSLLKPDSMNTLEEQLKYSDSFIPTSSVIRYCEDFGDSYHKIRTMLQRNQYKILDSTLTAHPSLDKFMYDNIAPMINWLNENVGIRLSARI